MLLISLGTLRKSLYENERFDAILKSRVSFGVTHGHSFNVTLCFRYIFHQFSTKIFASFILKVTRMATCLEKFRDTKIDEFSQKIPDGSYNVSDTKRNKEIYNLLIKGMFSCNVLFRLLP